MDKALLLKLELFDGTSQVVQITEDQATSLGINIVKNGPGLVIPLTNEVYNYQQISDNDDNFLNKNGNETPINYMYKIVKPEDLNLQPSPAPHVPRGRPRKRPIEQVIQDQSKSLKEPQVVIKQVRTRSGRVTKLPRHIRQDFKVIDTSEDSKHDTEIKTIEYDTSNIKDTQPSEPPIYLEQHSKKRSIPSYYRCPTCKKAYLGRAKMLNHFNKYPDHGPVPNFYKMKHNSTWNFLILTTQKFKEGSKGVKFCQELTVLLENARILAKFLFKPVENGESGYFIDEYLAHVFGIVSGNYILNENELQKDASFHEYLKKYCMEENKNSDDNKLNVGEQNSCNNDVINKKDDMTAKETKICTEEEMNKVDNSNILNEQINNISAEMNQIKDINFSSHVITNENTTTSLTENCSQTFVQGKGNSLDGKHFAINLINASNNHVSENKKYFQEETRQLSSATIEKEHYLLNTDDVMSFDNLNNQTLNLQSMLNSASELNNDAVTYVNMKFASAFDKKCNETSKENQLSSTNGEHYYDVPKHIIQDNGLLSQVDDLMLENVNTKIRQDIRNPLKRISEKKCDDYDGSKNSLDSELLSDVHELMLENISNRQVHKPIENAKKNEPDVKKNREYDIDKQMHSELLSHVEDLILENIDTGQVSSILDTSSNSDDIMNVDQFVNERYKKLTETDLELQNASLNLDLPPLDMFNFHTS